MSEFNEWSFSWGDSELVCTTWSAVQQDLERHNCLLAIKAIERIVHHPDCLIGFGPAAQ